MKGGDFFFGRKNQVGRRVAIASTMMGRKDRCILLLLLCMLSKVFSEHEQDGYSTRFGAKVFANGTSDKVVGQSGQVLGLSRLWFGMVHPLYFLSNGFQYTWILFV